MPIHIGVGGHDERMKIGLRPGDDQLLQVNRATEHIVAIPHKKRGDIVVFGGLFNQGAHGLLHRQVIADRDIVGGHLAADFVVIKGLHQGEFLFGGLVHAFEKVAFFLAVQPGKNRRRRVGFHAFNRAGGLAQIHFGKKSGCLIVLQTLQNVGKHIRVQDAVKLFSLRRGQRGQNLGDIFFVVIFQTLPHHVGGCRAFDNSGNLRRIIRLGGQGGFFRNGDFRLHFERLLLPDFPVEEPVESKPKAAALVHAA